MTNITQWLLSVVGYRGEVVINSKGAIWRDIESNYLQEIRGFVDIFYIQLLTTQADYLCMSGTHPKLPQLES